MTRKIYLFVPTAGVPEPYAVPDDELADLQRRLGSHSAYERGIFEAIKERHEAMQP